MLDGEAVERLIAFLPAFERGEFESADSHYRATGQSPPEVAELTRAIYATDLVLREFDWIAWKDAARRYAEDPALIGQADLDTVRKLLTISIRQDRFVGGLMPQLCCSGLIQAILGRLAALRRDETEGVLP